MASQYIHIDTLWYIKIFHTAVKCTLELFNITDIEVFVFSFPNILDKLASGLKYASSLASSKLFSLIYFQILRTHIALVISSWPTMAFNSLLAFIFLDIPFILKMPIFRLAYSTAKLALTYKFK